MTKIKISTLIWSRHRGAGHSDLNEWLDKIEFYFERIYYLTDKHQPQIAYLRVKKIAESWITEKRKEFAELSGQTIKQTPTADSTEAKQRDVPKPISSIYNKMKYSDLSETFIFETIDLFHSIVLDESDLLKNRLELNLQIPNVEFVKQQIMYNISHSKSTDKYIERLKKDFEQVFESSLIEDLRRAIYDIIKDTKFLESIGSDLDCTPEGEPYFIADFGYTALEREQIFVNRVAKYLFGDIALVSNYQSQTSNLIELYYNKIEAKQNAQINAKKLLILAETIQETIAEAEQSITRQPLIVEVVEETPKNTVERKKLQWNASNSALYHLFAKLSEKQTTKGEIPLNYKPKQLAQFLSESFEGLPTKETMLREIQKYQTKKGSAEKEPPDDSISLQQINFYPEP